MTPSLSILHSPSPLFHSQIWPFFSHPHTEATSVNCSLPLMMILWVLSWATTCLWEMRKMKSVCVCASESVCVRSLKGNASFDFLLITQHALCSVVNCPGPLFSQWGTGLEWSENTSSLPLAVYLLIYSLPLHPPSLSYVTFSSTRMQIKCLVAHTGQSRQREPTSIFIVFAWVGTSVWVCANLCQCVS